MPIEELTGRILKYQFLILEKSFSSLSFINYRNGIVISISYFYCSFVICSYLLNLPVCHILGGWWQHCQKSHFFTCGSISAALPMTEKVDSENADFLPAVRPHEVFKQLRPEQHHLL